MLHPVKELGILQELGKIASFVDLKLATSNFANT